MSVCQTGNDGFEKQLSAGNACYHRRDLRAAACHYRAAVTLDPDSFVAHFNLGIVSRDLEQWDTARIEFRQSLELDPATAPAYNNLGIVYEAMEEYEVAIACYREAIRLQDPFPGAHYNLGMLLLRLGRYEEGFLECEWRWRTERFTPFQCPQPEWQGGRLRGTLLVHAEQGAGDAIQFARFLPAAAELCDRILLVCHESLVALFRSIPGVDIVRAGGFVEFSQFDAHAPLLSLPPLLGTTLASLPHAVPYLKAPDRPFDLEDPPCPPSKLKVGLVWAGNPTQVNDHHRSCDVSELMSLLDVPGVVFYSLQVGSRSRELVDLGKRAAEVRDLSGQLSDFSDTALAIERLDLVISVCTSVLHLAGALGRPTWGLLSKRCDWRWMLNRDDSPWYPTLRLFRQRRLDDWAGLMQRVAGALSDLVACRGPTRERLGRAAVSRTHIRAPMVRNQGDRNTSCDILGNTLGRRHDEPFLGNEDSLPQGRSPT